MNAEFDEMLPKTGEQGIENFEMGQVRAAPKQH